MSIRIGNTILPLNNVGIQSYQHFFNAEDFQKNSSTQLYELTIYYDQHKIENIGFVVSYQKDIDNVYSNVLVDFTWDAARDIKIISTEAYDGKAIIYGA